MDFAIALLLFPFTLVVYFSYTSNFQKEEKGDLERLASDAKSISASLALGGYPDDWDNSSVIRIGISDNNFINAAKLKLFKQLDYPRTKKIFATPNDYFVFFLNSKGEVMNINGICGVGNIMVSTAYDIKTAYCYQDSDDAFLKDFMEDTFSADVYFNDIDSLASNLSKYGFIMMEHPLLTSSKFNEHKGKIENFSSNGGLLMVSGELATPQTNSMTGADFSKKSGQSSSQRTAIVNKTDTYLSLQVGQSMVFDQYYYMENAGAAEYTAISLFNQSNDNAIARWKYGNGTVCFFSDFDVSFFSGNFVSIVEEAAKSLVEGTCTPVNLSSISYRNLVNTERYLIYNSKVARMVIYAWS